MLTNVMVLSLAAMVMSGHVRGGGPHTPAFFLGVVADTGSATGSAEDSVQTLLTPDLLTHYIAVRKDLNNFWKTPANKPLYDSARAHAHTHSVTLNVPGVGQWPLQVGAFDYVDLTSREPAIAAIFKKDGFAPQQLEPTQAAAMRAAYAAAIDRATGKTIDDAASVAGKNVALAQAHRDDLEAVGVWGSFSISGGGGGGGGGNNMNP